MPPLPPNSTARVTVFYTTGRIEHQLTCRYEQPVTPAGAVQFVAQFLDELRPLLPNQWRTLRATNQAAGSNLSLPLSLDNLDGFAGSSTEGLVPADQEPKQVNFIGRGPSDGHKVRVGLFGMFVATTARFRLETPAYSQLDGAVDVLNTASAAGAFITIGGQLATWYRYVDVQYNSYWETRARRG